MRRLVLALARYLGFAPTGAITSVRRATGSLLVFAVGALGLGAVLGSVGVQLFLSLTAPPPFHAQVRVRVANPAVAKLLILQDRELHGCTGWLAAPRLVITAAHCVHGLNDPEVQVQLGANLVDGKPTHRLQCESVRVEESPRYSGAVLSQWDVAAVFLGPCFGAAPRAVPAPLPFRTMSFDQLKNHQSTLYGYPENCPDGQLCSTQGVYRDRAAGGALLYSSHGIHRGDSGGPELLSTPAGDVVVAYAQAVSSTQGVSRRIDAGLARVLNQWIADSEQLPAPLLGADG